MTGSKTICIVASSGISLTNFRGPMIREWKSLGYKVICVSIETREENASFIEQLGSDYYQIEGSRTGVGIMEGVKMIRQYKKLFNQLKPDYTFMYMSKPIMFGGFAAYSVGLKNTTILINGLESAYFNTGVKAWILRRVLNTLYRFVCRHSQNVLFQNNGDRYSFIKQGICKKENSYVVNGSGVDMIHFHRVPLPSEPVVLMVARLLWGKGIREYVEAIKIVKEKNPLVRFMLVGGLDSETAEALSKEELDDIIEKYDVEYCGYASDVRPFIEKCSVFTLPSYHEGTPRCVLEAMSMGRPIITTTTAGCKDTVEDGVSGYLVPVGDGQTLAERVLKLAASKDMRLKMGEESYLRCKEMYEVSKVNASINKIMRL